MEPHATLPAFADVFREHAPYAWRALRRLGVRDADVEDVCQEVFVVVHRKLPEFEGRSRLRTWIYGICVRAASDYRRRASVRREQPSNRVPEERHSAPQLKELERQQARALLDAALETLDEDKRAVFVLYENRGARDARGGGRARVPAPDGLFAAARRAHACPRRSGAPRERR